MDDTGQGGGKLGELFDERWRVGPLKDGTFRSPLHDERIAAILGIALGVAFTVCFVTGLISHVAQNPPSWFTWPSRPAWLYRVTQGVHVATGIGSIPLLLAKLWTVYPNLFRWPPLESIAHLVERISLIPLVAGGVFMLTTGFMNHMEWYPFGFFFPVGHFWGAWITMGALLIHLVAKWTVVGTSLRRGGAPPIERNGLGRRGFLAAVATAVGAVTVATVGQTFRPFRALSVLAARDPAAGVQGVPVNKTASEIKVLDAILDPNWRLRVHGAVRRELVLSRDDLRAMPQHEARLTIACVEGWSADGDWRGVRVRDILDLAGASDDATVIVGSHQRRGLYRSSELNPDHARDPDTMLALELNGEVLHVDHGFPCRLIGPNRPGVFQTKWVNEVEVL